MNTNIDIVLHFLEKCEQKVTPKSQRGKPLQYSHASMIVFFIHLMLKGIFNFKSMATYAACHYHLYGWQQAPCRKTIRRRFLALSLVLEAFIPVIAQMCSELNRRVFGFSWAFIDKSIFRALGGIWHKVHIRLGVVPHKSIDTDASWGFSPYHKWRFGYGLHLIVNQNRFPIAATVTTAKTKDTQLVLPLLAQIKYHIGLLVGDAGYFALRVLQKANEIGVFTYTHKCFQKATTTFKKLYNDLASTAQARILYTKRKPSVEPAFALIKNLFHLQGENQLPYKGLSKVQSFLLITVVTVQMMMFLNFSLNKDFAQTQTLKHQF